MSVLSYLGDPICSHRAGNRRPSGQAGPTGPEYTDVPTYEEPSLHAQRRDRGPVEGRGSAFFDPQGGRRKKGDGPWATHTHLICRATARSERWASRVDKSRATYRKRPEITTPRERQARAAAAGERWRRMCLWCQQNKKRNRSATGRVWVCNGADRWTRRMGRKRETAKVGGETGSYVSKVSKTSIESPLAQHGGREEGGPCPCSWCCRALTHNCSHLVQ